MKMPMNLLKVHRQEQSAKVEPSPEETEPLFLFGNIWLAANGSGHLPDRP
jgi:hypothetical protein